MCVGRTLHIDQMSEAIARELQKYGTAVDADVKAAVKKTANTVKKGISSNAPKAIKNGGKYAKSWTATKTDEKSHMLKMVVHSKKYYRLAHLLEKGHATRNGGRTRAYPHIKPAEEHGVELLKAWMRKAIERN